MGVRIVSMLSTDFAALFKHVTDNITTYVMFIAMMFMMYMLFVAIMKIITENIIKIILAIRAPINGGVSIKGDEKF